MDVGGEFVNVGALEEQDGVGAAGEGGVDSEHNGSHSIDERDELRVRNAELSACNADLEAQVSSLNEEVRQELS